MVRRAFSLLMMALLLACIIMLTFKVRQVEADAQTVCINADGSITPSGAPIVTSDNITYTFTGHITYPTYYGWCAKKQHHHRWKRVYNARTLE